MSAIIYLLQVSACLALFYGFYYIMLNRLTFFTINRYYLLFTLVLSFVVPLLTITVHQQYEAAPVMQQVINMRSAEHTIVYVVPSGTPIKTSSPVTWMQLLKYAYLLAVTGLFTHLLITLISFFTKLHRRKLSSVGNVHILRGDKHLPNGSFLNYIFLNDDELSAEETQQIIAHEMLHVKLYHSADRLLMKVVQIVLWFNPFVYLYARSMEENHEFEVDREMARSNDRNKYADLLLHLSIAKQGMLYHSFSKVPLKKRIVMLFNRPSAKVKRVVYLLVLPVILVSCLAFANIKKDDIKNFSLVRSTQKLIAAVKAGQDNMVVQLNKPIQLPLIATGMDSIKISNVNTVSQPNIVLPPANDTTRYSDVIDTRFLSYFKNAKVIIDDKYYPANVLYEISNQCVKNLSVNFERNIVNIQTKNDRVLYMTAHAKENLYKEKTTAQSQFYTRLKLTDDNGQRYDYVDMHTTTDSKALVNSGVRIAPNDKIGFLIDGWIYNEGNLKTILPDTIALLNYHGFTIYKPDMLYQNKYRVLYMLSPMNMPVSKYMAGQLDTANSAFKITSFKVSIGKIGILDTVTAFTMFNISYPFFKSSPVDTLDYSAQAYKTNPNAPLIELVNKLPNIVATDKSVLANGKYVSELRINNRPYGADIIRELKNLPANIVTEVQIINPVPSVMPVIMNVKVDLNKFHNLSL